MQGLGGGGLRLFGGSVFQLCHLRRDVRQFLLSTLVVFTPQLDEFDGQGLLGVGADACDLGAQRPFGSGLSRFSGLASRFGADAFGVRARRGQLGCQRLLGFVPNPRQLGRQVVVAGLL